MLSEIITLLLRPFARRVCTPSQASVFYKSREWKELRYLALKTYGSRCLACGATAAHTRIVVDHIKPLRTHWHLRLTLSNLQTLCESCNRGKGFRCRKDWRQN